MAEIMKPEDLPTNKEYYIGLNKRLKKAGFPELVIEGDMVFKDELHKILGIGIKLES